MRVDVAGTIEWAGAGLVFRGGADGAPAVVLDGNASEAASPVQMLLISLAACTAADIVDILDKSRVELRGLRIRMEAERAPEPPRRFTAIRLVYETTGLTEADRPKLQRAHDLSLEKYCSVLHTLRSDIEFSTELVLG